MTAVFAMFVGLFVFFKKFQLVTAVDSVELLLSFVNLAYCVHTLLVFLVNKHWLKKLISEQ